MSANTGTGPSPQWRRLYESAVLELNPQKIAAKIDEAESAIIERLQNAPEHEKVALGNALDLLRNLRKLGC